MPAHPSTCTRRSSGQRMKRLKKVNRSVATAAIEQRQKQAPQKQAVVVPQHRRNGPPWWFAVPALVLFAFIVLVPSARGLYYAFTDWDGLDPHFSFVGLRNFVEMWH